MSDLNLPAAQATVTGKGRKTRVVNVAYAARYIRQWLMERSRDVTHDYLFHSRFVDADPINPSTITALFRKLAKETGIQRLTPHRLRHTMATVLYNRTNDILAIQQLLGHSDIQTTRRYLHRDPEKSLEVARNNSPLGEMLKGKR